MARVRTTRRKRTLGERVRVLLSELIGGGGGADYKGAEVSRLFGDWSGRLQTSDQELRNNLRLLRGRARELGRNNAFARQFLNLLAVNVVGPVGYVHKSTSRVLSDGELVLDEATNDTIDEAFRNWSRGPVTLDGRHDLVSFSHLLVKTVARDGEVFVRLWRNARDNRDGLLLEAIDPDTIDDTVSRQASRDGEEIRLGVQVNQYGRPTAYVALVADPTRAPMQRHDLIPADQVLHLFMSDRVQQTRGVTWFTPVMAALHMFGEYTVAELTAARVGSSKQGFVTRKETVGEADGDVDITVETSPGSWDILPPGYGVETFDTDHPSAAFADFCKTILREVSTGLGVSYNALANDLEGVNYSSMRSGLLIERDMWRSMQYWFAIAFLTPVRQEWLQSALLRGTLKLATRDPEPYRSHTFTPRGWAWVDPLKDVTASILEIKNGLNSRTSVMAEQGKTLDETLEQLSDELELAKAEGIDLSAGQPGNDAAAASDAAAADDENADDGAAGRMLRVVRNLSGRRTRRK